MELLASLKRLADDHGRNGRPTKRRKQSKDRQSAAAGADGQDPPAEPAPTACPDVDSLHHSESTIRTECVSDAPALQPHTLGTTRPFWHIFRMAALGQLEEIIGSFLWQGLLSSQQRFREQTTPTANTFTATVSLHSPPLEGYDFMLEINVSSVSGQAVAQAKLLSVEALRVILGEMLFQGVMRSKGRKEEVSRDQIKHTEAVQVYGAGQEGDCNVTVMLDFETGRRVAARY